jgi:hypothetical protein
MRNELDQIRAAGAQHFALAGTTAGDEPLTIDLALTPTPGKHWIVEHLCLIAQLQTRAPADNRGFPPLSGLFLCPPGTPIESLATAQSTWLIEARPILLPMGLPAGDFGSIAVADAAPFPYALVMAPGFKVTVPQGWFLRAIVTCQQGTATPGPGVNSRGILRALAYQEVDNVCA